MIAPHPDLKKKIDTEMKKIKDLTSKGILANKIRLGRPDNPVGLNDGVIYPGIMFPVGTPAKTAKNAAANRAPLRGTLQVVVESVDFSDKVMTETKQHFERTLFFSGNNSNRQRTGVLPEVTHGLVDIDGQVVGPFRLPKKISEYAHGASGTGSASPNARTMAKDAAVAANPTLNFTTYDNDGDNFVDAFIVIHAGTGVKYQAMLMTSGVINGFWKEAPIQQTELQKSMLI